MSRIKTKSVPVIVFEPSIDRKELFGSHEFKRRVDLIVLNRLVDDLPDAADKAYTRDIDQHD